jgi:hypothetical protein
LKRDFTFDISTAKENEMQTSKQKTSRRKWSTSISKKNLKAVAFLSASEMEKNISRHIQIFVC